ncbi:DNA-binding IclR family transcriptional regulator [Nocardioides zeae]|uniref:DNA-binding IclR family transcriptional regulator n=2 Tax=Nocardioides zeae TaxID=1457234 RepID=A0AAJ1U2P8_9ACTN|nr:IclR family transcriptional regulator [Nocardioides zeae]MDQ1104865.1 DNA-binding IclR family transcriptional regulator [Nocardioides zeae]MDR6175424.1 DNA-binding IclR family transcriptional regulator [Nocardioides zeae]MDR6208356.1 DNA-binding IclR family transcriptional regulator [Nocardioides zeae]
MSEAVGMVGRAAGVLRALAELDTDGARTADVARAVDLPRPTVHRVLTALLDEGLVDRVQETGRWHLGPELFVLGAAAARRYDVAQVAHPTVRRLAEVTGESAFFSVRRGEDTVCLLREDGDFPIRSHVLTEGSRFPLGVVSAGLALLAHLPDREVEDYLARVDLVPSYGRPHATEPLRQRIATTRTDGYATNPGLNVEGSWGLAAAVFDRAGRPSWALTLTGIESRFAQPRRAELGALLLREAHALTGRLSAGPSAAAPPR